MELIMKRSDLVHKGYIDKADFFDLLTPFEKEVFELKINGHSYTDIAEILKKDKKQIDNTIQRIKRKIKDNLDY